MQTIEALERMARERVAALLREAEHDERLRLARHAADVTPGCCVACCPGCCVGLMGDAEPAASAGRRAPIAIGAG